MDAGVGTVTGAVIAVLCFMPNARTAVREMARVLAKIESPT